jgi:hypothetical protein
MLPKTSSGYLVLAAFITVLGVFFALAPDDWYGPSWSYFSTHSQAIIPAGGFGLGVCLTIIGLLQMVSIAARSDRLIGILFGVSGFVLWTAGTLLIAEGLAGHQGLMEGPLFLTLSVHKVLVSVSVFANRDK